MRNPKSDAGTERTERSAGSHSRLLPMGLSACAMMIAVDYLLTGNWSGTPYYILAGLMLAIAARFNQQSKTEQAPTEEESAPYLPDCPSAGLVEIRENI